MMADAHHPTFGYHPVVDDLDVVLPRARFARALVLDESIVDLVDHVQECRALWDADVALPAGVYVAMNGRCFPADRVQKNRETGVFEEI